MEVTQTLQQEQQPLSKRSHTGCVECRRMHRKCDEAKPSCSACTRGKKSCSYGIKLSWGGRPFGKSRFGKCVVESGNLKKVVSTGSSGQTQFSFVYGLSPKEAQQQRKQRLRQVDKENPESDQQGALVRTGNNETTTTTTMRTEDQLSSPISILQQIGRNPVQYSWLPQVHKELIGHYLGSTTHAICCLEKTRRDYCSIIFPMALETPHLLSALLCLSAIHRRQIGLEQSRASIDVLRATSVEQLRQALLEKGADETTAATTLKLCVCEITEGGEKPNSWRLHLSGAAAILDHLLPKNVKQKQLSKTQAFLRRWYASIECIAFLCGQPFRLNDNRREGQVGEVIGNDIIDDLAGCSVSLIPILEEISRLSMTQDYHDVEGMRVRRQRCDVLIGEVKLMLTEKRPMFGPGVDESISPVAQRDFIALDEVFHHMALLQIYQRTGDIPSSNADVQVSVHAIIEGVSSMTFTTQSCPGVASLQPLFTAGCEACTEEDRSAITALLNKMEKTFGIGNVKTARSFLQELWVLRNTQQDTSGWIRWDSLIGMLFEKNHRMFERNHRILLLDWTN